MNELKHAVLKEYSWLSSRTKIYSLIYKGTTLYTSNMREKVVGYARRYGYTFHNTTCTFLS